MALQNICLKQSRTNSRSTEKRSIQINTQQLKQNQHIQEQTPPTEPIRSPTHRHHQTPSPASFSRINEYPSTTSSSDTPRFFKNSILCFSSSTNLSCFITSTLSYTSPNLVIALASSLHPSSSHLANNGMKQIKERPRADVIPPLDASQFGLILLLNRINPILTLHVSASATGFK
ncbi:hypothetical protein Droror1_Dr00015081 [Drosera rotundifolia]